MDPDVEEYSFGTDLKVCYLSILAYPRRDRLTHRDCALKTLVTSLYSEHCKNTRALYQILFPFCSHARTYGVGRLYGDNSSLSSPFARGHSIILCSLP